MTIASEVRQIILEEVSSDDDGLAARLTDDYPLLENQVLDSMGIFELVSSLERRYGIEILDEEVVPGNFGSLAAIARFVEEKRKALSR